MGVRKCEYYQEIKQREGDERVGIDGWRGRHWIARAATQQNDIDRGKGNNGIYELEHMIWGISPEEGVKNCGTPLITPKVGSTRVPDHRNTRKQVGRDGQKTTCRIEMGF